MKEWITNRQISFMIFAVVVGYGIINLPNSVATVAGTGGCIPLVLITIIISIFTYIISQLGYNNENETLSEYSQKLVGKILGKIITITYMVYFLIILSYLVRSYAEIMTLIFLPKTPLWVISLVLLLVVGYGLTKPLATIARLTEIYVFIVIIGFLFIQIIVATQGEIINIRPLLGSESIITYVKATYNLSISFLGIELIMFVPMNKEKNKGIAKYTILSMVFICLLYIFVVESTIAVVGVEDVVYYNASLLKVLMGIDLSYLEALRRLDGFYVVFWTMNLFCDISIISYLVLSQSKKFFINKPHNLMVFFVIAVIFILSQLPKVPDLLQEIPTIVRALGIITVIIIPSILFIIMKVKKNDKQN